MNETATARVGWNVSEHGAMSAATRSGAVASVLDPSSSDWDSFIGHSQMARHMRTIDCAHAARALSGVAAMSAVEPERLPQLQFPDGAPLGAAVHLPLQRCVRGLLGDRHTRAFGRPSREVWSDCDRRIARRRRLWLRRFGWEWGWLRGRESYSNGAGKGVVPGRARDAELVA